MGLGPMTSSLPRNALYQLSYSSYEKRFRSQDSNFPAPEAADGTR